MALNQENQNLVLIIKNASAKSFFKKKKEIIIILDCGSKLNFCDNVDYTLQFTMTIKWFEYGITCSNNSQNITKY